MNDKLAQITPRRRWLSIAAAAAVLIIGGLWLLFHFFETVKMIAFSTNIGEKKEITLSDGTVVYLNENTRLFYPEEFKKDGRTVKFSGEAYFEVAKNPSRPFKIETTNTTVTVLGTAFNLRAYPNESVNEILVAEGEVKFAANLNDHFMVLTANQQGIFDGRIIKKIDQTNSNAYAWKSGILSYKDTPLTDVLQDLERIFNVKTNLQNPQMAKCTLTGIFPNAQPAAILAYAATFLEMELVQTGNHQFQLRGGICE